MGPQRVGSITPRGIRDFEKGEEKGEMSRVELLEGCGKEETLHGLEPLF